MQKNKQVSPGHSSFGSFSAEYTEGGEFIAFYEDGGSEILLNDGGVPIT